MIESDDKADLSRRAFLTSGGALCVAGACVLAPGAGAAQTPPAQTPPAPPPAQTPPAPPAAGAQEWLRPHGLSIFGELGEKPDFDAFAYVRRDAPRGGRISRDAYGAFNSMNMFILKGDAPPSMYLVFDTLLAASLDERDAMYPLVARSIEIAPDRSALRFRLRKEARFHDGSPLTARDAAFSLNILKTRGHPSLRVQLRDMESAVAENDHTLLVRLGPNRSRDLPIIVSSQPIFSEKFYSTRAFDEATLEPPLGSAAYKVGKFEAGRFIAFERVPDYWGRDLPVNRGQYNFDEIRFDYFSDRNVAFEAFKAGATTAREEFTSSIWANGYNFPAFNEKRVLRRVVPDYNISGIQGWFFNVRRGALGNRHFRRAVSLAFDFEWTNANLMYGAYKRTQSYFENSEMKATGKPEGEELALLEPFRAQLPADVFGEAALPPVSDGSGQDRNLLKQAMDILGEGGFRRVGDRLCDRDGKPTEIEFLDFSSALERHTQPFIKNLKLLGIEARMRIVDAAQYRRRVDEFDFDVVTNRLIMAYSPGEELLSLFGSRTANEKGSRNIVGVSDPVVDALVERALVVKTRAELITLCRALDRVLRAQNYWTPHWFKPSHWLAHWDCYGQPERAPRYDTGMLTTWWWEEARAQAIRFQGR